MENDTFNNDVGAYCVGLRKHQRGNDERTKRFEKLNGSTILKNGLPYGNSCYTKDLR